MEENLKNNFKSCIKELESSNSCKNVLKELFPYLFLNQHEINYTNLLDLLTKEKSNYQLIWNEKEKILNERYQK